MARAAPTPPTCAATTAWARLAANEGADRFEPLPRILRDFTPESKPLFWLRLVAFAHLCTDYVNRAGTQLGFEARQLPLEDLLARSGDPVILAALRDHLARCEAQLRGFL